MNSPSLCAFADCPLQQVEGPAQAALESLQYHIEGYGNAMASYGLGEQTARAQIAIDKAIGQLLMIVSATCRECLTTPPETEVH